VTDCGYPVTGTGGRCQFAGWWSGSCYWHSKLKALENGGLPVANITPNGDRWRPAWTLGEEAWPMTLLEFERMADIRAVIDVGTGEAW
jgi:hypothetical protein